MMSETPDQREERFEELMRESVRAAADYDSADQEMDYGAEQELSERQALRRVKGFSTQLQDISEAEYRELQLERVVLVGVWTEGTIANAENSLTELRALAETAGSEVLDGLIQINQILQHISVRARYKNLKKLFEQPGRTLSFAMVSSLHLNCDNLRIS
jgi:GTP-binding protein HflX